MQMLIELDITQDTMRDKGKASANSRYIGRKLQMLGLTLLSVMTPRRENMYDEARETGESMTSSLTAGHFIYL